MWYRAGGARVGRGGGGGGVGTQRRVHKVVHRVGTQGGTGWWVARVGSQEVARPGTVARPVPVPPPRPVQVPSLDQY